MIDNQQGSATDAGNPIDAGATDAGAGSATPAGNSSADGTVLGDANGSATPTETQLGNDGDKGFDWTGAGIEADNLSKIEAKGWKTPADVLKGYSELESKLGEREIKIPDAESATQEDWDAYYKATGRPDNAADYKFNLPDGVPEDLPYDTAFADEFRQWAHETGLSPRQADALHAKYLTQFAETSQSQFQALDEKVTNAHNELVKKWGVPTEPNFQHCVDSATRAMRALGLEDSLKASGLLHESGAVTDPLVAIALERVGSQMFKEDSFFSGETATGSNPFIQGDGFNMTEQSQLISSDPQRAKHLIRAAGLKPEDFGVRT